MKSVITKLLIILCFTFSIEIANAQVQIAEGDPPNNTDLPFFFKSKLEHIDEELALVEKGKVEAVAISPGGLPVYAVYYGEKEEFHSQANYNSAVAARNPAYYAQKGPDTKPVVFIIGPVHGQEVEGIVGLVNLIHIAETGKDYRGQDWSELQQKIEQCRVIIIPCANPDGRRRCPYDSFLGLHEDMVTKYGQGTRKDGSMWGWPGAKSNHPMVGDVGILGSYFNDAGVNIMHDEFFHPMTAETKAILEITRKEAPDMTVTVHSHETPPAIYNPMYSAWYMKERVYDLEKRLNNRYKEAQLSYMPDSLLRVPRKEDDEFPPHDSFNLVCALHNLSGTMAFAYENNDGTVSDRIPEPFVTYEDILDIQLLLYDEMLDYALNDRLYWTLEE
ncbi:M14 family zinc carboxypeptidase [Sunxiuqinia elliptica]|uniref:Zinc carboxypeptidase n=1 Tax=Sunxiuqinia elliptica TaxID=655355 RepID=A0A1I2GNB1_9BACT|nr:M14 family zinc carboxypeptidase [Sunxiuqinia elliptica]SFF18081.1 Zinc carboxypeptidase [Sunxiuqinia elliptica]